MYPFLLVVSAIFHAVARFINARNKKKEDERPCFPVIFRYLIIAEKGCDVLTLAELFLARFYMITRLHRCLHRLHAGGLRRNAPLGFLIRSTRESLFH